MDQLFLHIGLSKTGSSAIQSWLSANSSALAALGVNYADLVPEAKLDRISPGNGEHLARYLGVRHKGPEISDRRLCREMRRTYFDGESTAIISAEALTNAHAPRIKQLNDVLESIDIQVAVVAYIRSIYDHCWSGYQQMIKRAGYHGSFAEFAASYPNVQVQALRRWSKAFDDIRVLNYDSAKDALIESFVAACEFDLPSDIDPSVARVNRSLSAFENSLLVEVNRQAEERGLEFRALLSDALIYANPGAQSSFVYDEAVLEVLREKYERDVAWVNRRFLTVDPLRIEPMAGPETTAIGETEVAPEIRALIGALLDQIVEPAGYLKRGSSSSSDGPGQGS